MTMQQQKSLVDEVDQKIDEIDSILPLDLLRTGDLEIFEGEGGEIFLFREKTFDSLNEFVEKDAAKLELSGGRLEVEKIPEDDLDTSSLQKVEEVQSKLLD